jgi:hypothetical protein
VLDTQLVGVSTANLLFEGSCSANISFIIFGLLSSKIAILLDKMFSFKTCFPSTSDSVVISPLKGQRHYLFILVFFCK